MDAVYLHNKYVEPSATTVGCACGGWWTGCATTGSGRTRASGRCAAAGATSSTRSSCPGWLWTAASVGRQALLPGGPGGAWLKVRDENLRGSHGPGWTRAARRSSRPMARTPLDASSLLMRWCFFMAPNDPRMLSTLAAIRRPWLRGPGRGRSGLPYDPQPPRTACRARRGPSIMCSFWLVEALTPAGAPTRRGWKRRGCCSSKCSATPTTSACLASRPGTSGRGPGQLPAGVHSSGLDQRRLQPRRGARGTVRPARPSSRIVWTPHLLTVGGAFHVLTDHPFLSHGAAWQAWAGWTARSWSCCANENLPRRALVSVAKTNVPRRCEPSGAEVVDRGSHPLPATLARALAGCRACTSA